MTYEPRTTWLEERLTMLTIEIHRGDFERAQSLLDEIKLRGVKHDPDKVERAALDTFVDQVFHERLSGHLVSAGIMTMRQLLSQTPSQLYAITGLVPVYVQQIIEYVRLNYHWEEGHLAQQPRFEHRQK